MIDRRQGGREACRGSGRSRPGRGDHHDAHVGYPDRDELEQQQRLIVGMMEVVNDHEKRRTQRHEPQKLCNRVEPVKPGRLGMVDFVPVVGTALASESAGVAPISLSSI